MKLTLDNPKVVHADNVAPPREPFKADADPLALWCLKKTPICIGVNQYVQKGLSRGDLVDFLEVLVSAGIEAFVVINKHPTWEVEYYG